MSLQLTSWKKAKLFPWRLIALLPHVSRSSPFWTCYCCIEYVFTRVGLALLQVRCFQVPTIMPFPVKVPKRLLQWGTTESCSNISRAAGNQRHLCDIGDLIIQRPVFFSCIWLWVDGFLLLYITSSLILFDLTYFCYTIFDVFLYGLRCIISLPYLENARSGPAPSW